MSNNATEEGVWRLGKREYNGSIVSVVLKLSDVSESPGDLVKQRFLGLPPRVYDSIALR